MAVKTGSLVEWTEQSGSSLKSLPIALLLVCVSGRLLENPHSGNLYSYKPHRRKRKAKVSQHWVWQRFLSYDTKSTGQTKWTLGKYLNFVHPKLLYIHRVKRPPTE